MGVINHHQHFQYIHTPTPTAAENSTLVTLLKRKTCGPDDDDGQCQKPVSSQALPIGLGVGIPVAIAIAVLIYMHYRHVKKLKKEEEADKDIDVDIDMDDYNPSDIKQKMEQANNQNRNFDNHYDDDDGDEEKSKRNNSGSDRTMTGGGGFSSEDPFYGTMPYLSHPDANGSKPSLDEYSRSINSVYENQSTASVYGSSIPRYPSPARTKYSEQHSSSPFHNSNAFGYPISKVGSNSSASHSLASGNTNNQQNNISVIKEENTTLKQERHKSPFADQLTNGDDDASSISSSSTTSSNSHNEYRDTDYHNRIEQKLAEGIQDIEGSNNDNDKFVLYDDDNNEEEQQQDKRLTTHSLYRKDTGHYNRVKSFYREYMPDEELEREQNEQQDVEKYNYNPVNKTTTTNEFINIEESNEEDTEEHPSSYASAEEDDINHSDDREVHDYDTPDTSGHADMLQGDEDVSAGKYYYPQREQEDSLTNEGYYYYPNHNNDYTQSVYSRRNTDDGSIYSGMPQYPQYGRPTSASEYSLAQDNIRPESSSSRMPPQQQQQQQNRPPPIPLPKLSDLPTPHSLNETANPIAFAPQSRYKGASSPQPQPPQPQQPNNNAFNPVTDWTSEQQKTNNGALPSPHAWRQSLTLMSAVDFAPPKKFAAGNGRTRSSSASNLSMGSRSPVTPQSPAGFSSRGAGGSGLGGGNPYSSGNKGLSSPQLVPDAGNNDMLKPSMDMRS